MMMSPSSTELAAGELVRVLPSLAHHHGASPAIGACIERRVRALHAGSRAVNSEMEAVMRGITHALRSPAWAVDGLLKPLLTDCAQDVGDEFLKDVRSALEAVQRITGLVNDLAYFAKVCQHTMQCCQVDLTLLADSVAAELETREEAGQSTAFVVARDLHTRGDPALLRIAIERLMHNAWRFTRDAPCPRIEFGVDFEHTGAVSEFAEPVYCLRDNGVGFDPRAAEEVFKPFSVMHTTDQGAGNGMGLAIVRRIVHRHGGRIWAHTQPGHGSTFCFTFSR